MRVWINSGPRFQKLRYALASGHRVIILKDFNPPLESSVRNARFRVELRLADRIYSGVGEGDGELGWISDDSALGDAIALIFLLRSCSRRCNRSAWSAVAVPFSAVRASNSERSGMRA